MCSGSLPIQHDQLVLVIVVHHFYKNKQGMLLLTNNSTGHETLARFHFVSHFSKHYLAG